jgi:hypothetical protein
VACPEFPEEAAQAWPGTERTHSENRPVQAEVDPTREPQEEKYMAKASRPKAKGNCHCRRRIEFSNAEELQKAASHPEEQNRHKAPQRPRD